MIIFLNSGASIIARAKAASYASAFGVKLGKFIYLANT